MSSATDLIAKRYARALFNASMEARILEDVALAFSQFNKLLQAMPMDVYRVLLDPTISRNSLQFCIATILKKSPKLVRNFCDILIQEGRLKFVKRIEFYFQSFLRNFKGESLVNVYTAYNLSEDFCTELKEAIAYTFDRKVLLNIHEDRNLFGGIIIEVDGVRLDSSILGTLSKLSHYMKGAL